MPQLDKTTPPHEPQPRLLSCNDIAVQINRGVATVWRAIKRLKIQPAQQTAGGLRFYTEDVIPLIKQSLRRFRNR